MKIIFKFIIGVLMLLALNSTVYAAEQGTWYQGNESGRIQFKVENNVLYIKGTGTWDFKCWVTRSGKDDYDDNYLDLFYYIKQAGFDLNQIKSQITKTEFSGNIPTIPLLISNVNDLPKLSYVKFNMSNQSIIKLGKSFGYDGRTLIKTWETNVNIEPNFIISYPYKQYGRDYYETKEEEDFGRYNGDDKRYWLRHNYSVIPNFGIETLILNEGVTKIDREYNYLPKLKTLTLPKSLVQLSIYGFDNIESQSSENETQLTTVNIPSKSKLKNLKLSGFNNLKNINIPNDNIISDLDITWCPSLINAFENVTFSKLVFLGRLTESNITSIDLSSPTLLTLDRFCLQLTKIKELVLSPNIKTIHESAFGGCTNLIKITNLSKWDQDCHIEAFTEYVPDYEESLGSCGINNGQVYVYVTNSSFVKAARKTTAQLIPLDGESSPIYVGLIYLIFQNFQICKFSILHFPNYLSQCILLFHYFLYHMSS